ncbi:MAG: peptide/nickel transport system ATP-binding protein [Verrucomicrobiales bacterium]|jgi:peptide/nickel transport system ATP-binding protein
MPSPILQVRDLQIAFDTDAGQLTAVDGVSFSVESGRTLGIVGESGCGKSVSAFSIMQLLPRPMGKVLAGSIEFEGKELLDLDETEMAHLRGNDISMIFQEPMTALNPVQKIGAQIDEVFELHKPGITREDARRGTIEILDKVGIPAPEIRANEYPHQLSGGMRQRVVIAIALAMGPKLLIADEPTTALDVTVQAQILDLMQAMQSELGMAIILITHDLGVIAETCDDVVVMYAGRVVERAPVVELFQNPQHPYTQGLLASMPRLETPRKSRLKTIEGNVPSLAEMPSGCRFASRCPNTHTSEQVAERPAYREISPDHWIEACPCFVNS